MFCTLSTLFSPSRRDELAAAIRRRTSCRSFLGAPTQSQQVTLAYLTGRYALPGARLVWLRVDDSCFSDSLAGVSRITGCRLAAAITIQGDTWQNRLHAGIIGEALVLEAAAMGLGSCWATGSLRRSILPLSIPAGEELLCVIALGQPAMPLAEPALRQRKTPDQLCIGRWRDWPEELIAAVDLVRQAPSTLNLQPWTLRLDEESAFVLTAPAHAALDAGIALCHAELSLSTPHDWQFQSVPGSLHARALPR